MTQVIPEDYANVVHQFALTGDSEVMVVTYGVSMTSGASGSPSSYAAALQAEFETNMLGQLSNQYHTIGCEFTWQDTPLPNPPSIGFAVGTGVGARSSDVAPQNTAVLVHKRSSIGGRQGRGRMYFPGVIESVVDAKGALTTGEVNGWNTALAAWLADIIAIADIVAPCILHDSTGAYASAAPAIVTSFTCDPITATQRRRLRP